MTFRRLVFQPGPGGLGTDTFAWLRGGESSFLTDLDPELRSLGDVPRPYRDFAAFATGVFLADRTVARPKSWRRPIELEVPVYDATGWTELADHWAQTLEILSSDAWQLTFTLRAEPEEMTAQEHPEVDRVLLFSGGADSLCGAIRSLAAGERLLLVSHWDWSGHSAVQERLAAELAAPLSRTGYPPPDPPVPSQHPDRGRRVRRREDPAHAQPPVPEPRPGGRVG